MTPSSPDSLFLVGVALPYSIATAISKGQKLRPQARTHTSGAVSSSSRSASSFAPPRALMTNFTFEDTLTQIGLGYTFAFLLPSRVPAGSGSRSAPSSSATGSPGPSIPRPDPASTRPPSASRSSWHQQSLHRLRSPLEQEQQPRPGLRRLVPQSLPASPAASLYNDGGYLTLSFIPTLGTMLLGLAAGQWFRYAAPEHPPAPLPHRRRGPYRRRPAASVHRHLPHRQAHLDARPGRCSAAASASSSSPPSPGSWTCKHCAASAFPLVVVGMNSIAAYVIAHLWEDFIVSNFRINLGFGVFPTLRPRSRARHARRHPPARLLGHPLLDASKRIFLRI